ncbi:hypothetical protein EON67_11110 [archaeon]|nr:MAG: hypothetical protein EON67_11110 [archaeon]
MQASAGVLAGELYEGEMASGKPHGHGTCVYRNGLMYEGQWQMVCSACVRVCVCVCVRVYVHAHKRALADRHPVAPVTPRRHCALLPGCRDWSMAAAC